LKTSTREDVPFLGTSPAAARGAEENRMTNKELIGLLNQGIELEYQAFLQYYYQSLKLKGLETATLREMLKEEADAELGHAKALAERVVALGGEPSMKVAPVKIGKTPKEMIKYNLDREAKAIALYRKIVKSLHGTQGNELVYHLILTILGDELKDVEEFEAFLD
jgi:bacterioferritin